MSDKKKLFLDIYNSRKNQNEIQKVDYDYWSEDIYFTEMSDEKLKEFQSNESFHFCIARIDDYNEIMYHAQNHCNQLSVEIFNKLLSIGDSLVGYNEEQKKVLYSRNPRVASYVTANHLIYLTFLLKHFKFSDFERLKILEIGGGYGNICRLLFKSLENIDSYTILDIPGMSKLQDFFLRENLNDEQQKKIILTESQNSISEQEITLTIANHSLSELPIDKYFDLARVLDKTEWLFYSTCLGSHSEYMKIFHLLSIFNVEELFFEGTIAHILLKKKSVS
jgi:hypothetical protein